MVLWGTLFALYFRATFVPGRTRETIFNRSLSAPLPWLQVIVGGIVAFLSVALVRRYHGSKRWCAWLLGVGMPWLAFTVIEPLLRTPPALPTGFTAALLKLLPFVWSYVIVTFVGVGIWDIVTYGDEPLLRKPGKVEKPL